jgi:hypothetical protein
MINLSGKRLTLIMGVMTWAFPGVAQRTCSPQKNVAVEQIVLPELRYRLIDKFGSVRFCDPECWGPCSLIREQEHAEQAFPQIKRQEEAFHTIVQHLELGTIREFSGEQKLSVYREYKKLLCGMSLEMQGENHKFEFAAANGFRVEGIVSPKGEITVTKKEPVPLICPK